MCSSIGNGAFVAVFILKKCERKRKNYADGIKYVMIYLRFF